MNEAYEQLVQSSILFAKESISNALEADAGSNDRWPFALLHVVTSLELSAKALLAKSHPVFVRESFERSDKTVNFENAFRRIQDSELVGVSFSERDHKRLRGAITLRNQIAHGGTVSKTHHAMAAKYFEVFAFLRDFFAFQLNTKLNDIAEPTAVQKLMTISKHVDELEKRARELSEDFSEYWFCPECTKEYVVDTESEFRCLFCHWEEPLFQCQRCDSPIPEYETFDPSELFEWQFDEGRVVLVDDFGISERKVCETCYKKLRSVVHEARLEIEYWQQEEEYQNYIENALHRDRF